MRAVPAAEAAPLVAPAVVRGLDLASEVVEITIRAGTVAAAVTLTMQFNPAQAAPGKLPSIFVYNERTGRSIFLGGEVRATGEIATTINRFSKFAVFAIRPLPALADIADHWGRGSIRTLTVMGIVSGFPDGRFNPYAGVTRAEFVSMLTRALGLAAKPEAAAMLYRLVAER